MVKTSVLGVLYACPMEKKRLLVNFKATEAEYALWKAAAELSGQSFSAWARGLLNEASGTPVVKTVKTSPPRTEKISPGADKVIDTTGAKVSVKVKPSQCVNRVPKGSYCKHCETIHQK